MESTRGPIIETEELDEDEMKGKYLMFWTDHQLFAMPISDVVQIIGIQEITPVPSFPIYAKGVINLRGSIIPVIDVRLRLGRDEMAYGERTCIIVTKIEDSYIGFIVDSVDEVTTISDDNISPPPMVCKDRVNSFLTGIGKARDKVIMLVDTTKILNEDEIELIAEEV
ncbi:MAG: chemotaxis protein CheW [Clostridia bacterium]|nr:chemotaxis protein CheW [Clostridia bacterium]